MADTLYDFLSKDGLKPGELMMVVGTPRRHLTRELPDGRILVMGEKSMWFLPKPKDSP